MKAGDCEFAAYATVGAKASSEETLFAIINASPAADRFTEKLNLQSHGEHATQTQSPETPLGG